MALENRDYMREERGEPPVSIALPPATRALLLANICTFVGFILAAWVILPYIAGVRLGSEQIARSIVQYAGLVPERALSELWLWQLVTYPFVHPPKPAMNIVYLAFNLYVLFWFGREVETLYGARRFLALYFLGAVVGGLAYCTLVYEEGPLVGASSAVYAVMVVYALHYPRQRILVILVPTEAWVVVSILVGIDVLLHLSGPEGRVAYLAHLAGAATGYAFYALQGPLARLLERLERRIARAERRQSEEAIEARVDTLLEKISREGMSSLTRKERDFLQSASVHYQKRT